MQQKKFQFVDRLIGFILFAIALTTYSLTIEPSVSLWDCPEFIACGYKLEIGHPPGAPFFMLVANLFSQFASSPLEVARMVNFLSALLSAGCIFFLFLTITYFARKLICGSREMTVPHAVLIEACGVVGSLAYAFSDTFWFSAVEAEVYAFSSFLTALVFWLMLKWEETADNPSSDRWLILIAYLIGISVGVHLLNLLCIPPMVLVAYYRKSRRITRKGTLAALVFGFLSVAFVLYGIIPGVVKAGGWSELLFTNLFGFNYNTGLIVFIIMLTIALTMAVRKTRKRLWHTSALCLMMLLIGYSCYAVIYIRSMANPPMDENSPDDIFALGSYLSREQYGDTPLLYGHSYSSAIEREPQGEYLVPKIKEGDVVYQRSKDSTEHKYVVAGRRQELIYKDNMIFPRMHSYRHADAYVQWMGGVNMVNNHPTQWDNLRFFLSYQVNFMYIRYFLWNFVGRQNNIQGHGEAEHGNWITGIKPVDDVLLSSDTSKMPSDLRNNKGRNVFYALPLLLGLLGLTWQVRKGREGSRQWNIVMLLFLMTGIAIVVYINQTPLQTRERDYSYAGSFYAFSIWIGLGVAAVKSLLERARVKGRIAVALGSAVCFFVPLQMLSQTWDDHDRSDRYVCRDFGQNYLQSTQQSGNPILLCNGDNDTFPLWYNQEVEGVRTDVRVCNTQYAQTDWYADQMKRPAYYSPALPKEWGRNESLVDDIINHCGGARHVYVCISVGGSLMSSLKDHRVLEGLAYRIVPDSVGTQVDTERLYDNVMHRFKFAGLAAPGLYLDSDALHMANTHQYVMSILIDSLMRRKDMKRAMQVTEKWQKEMPSYNVPYTYAALSMAKCFYATGNKADGDRIVLDLMKRSDEWLTWFSTMEKGRLYGSMPTVSEWLTTMHTAMMTAYENDRTTIMKQYYDKYEEYIERYGQYGL